MRPVEPDALPAGVVEAEMGELAESAARPRFSLAGWHVAGGWELLRLVLDLVLLLAAGGLSQTVGDDAPHAFGATDVFLFVGLSLVLLAIAGSYRPSLGIAVLDDVAICFGVTAVATMTVTFADGLLSSGLPSMNAAIRLWVFSAVYVSAGHAGLLVAQRRLYRSGRGLAPTLIIGAGHVGHLAAARLLEAPGLGLRPVGFLDKEPLAPNDAPGHPVADGLPVLGASWDLESIVKEHGVEHVLLAFSNAPHDVLLDIVHRCDRLGLRVSVVPRLFQRMPSRVTVAHVGGLPILELQPVDPKSMQYAIKYAIDRVVAVVAIVLFSPLLIGAALAVLISLGRPIFYRQRRVGMDGREFSLIKFRSMRLSDEQELTFSPTTAPGGVEGEDRRSRTGAFLRRWSLDEVPQLFNILKGEMSFVGPRPERPEYVAFFDEHVFRYGERHRIKGGLTGWAQVHGLRGGKSSIADRVEWDNYYIENFSLLLDLKILWLTVAVVLRGDAT
jgi:exopolysaccharide biosynthesis polyprenyl glycosylphosphotransferase